VNRFHVRVSPQTIWGYILRCVECGCIIRSSYRSIEVFVSWIYNIRIYNITINLSLCLNSLCLLYFLCVCLHCLTLWWPAILRKALFLYLRRHNILTRKNIKNFELGINNVFITSYVRYHASWNLIIFASKQNLSWAKIIIIIPPTNYNVEYTHLVSKCLLLINSCLKPSALSRCCIAFRRQINL